VAGDARRPYGSGVRSIGLPIEPLLPALARALGAAGTAVLQAPPGAGKTTVVPLALLEEPWLGDREILLLEPRRLAARAAAQRMADLLGQRVGETVGYRIRHDSLVGPATRITVVTEGILTRLLQHDPALERAGLVIFDEFHERSLHADLGLALTLLSRREVRPDLRLLVMSATLEAAAVARLLGDAPVLASEGRSHPVETRYRPPRPEARLEAAVAAVVHEALAEDSGDVLVFLPGQGEIRRTSELLGSGGAGWTLHPLYGALPQGEQDAALRPARPGQRKVVLATSVAETSLTIEGVQVVVDSGLARVPRFSPGSGMARLVTVRVSRASADQRRGRAGRTAPGVCYRLWAAAEDHHLLPRATPEIREADLAPLALELAVAGIGDAGSLTWLDPPPSAALSTARTLLRQLEAIDDRGRATPHGRQIAELGTHPRLGHLLIRGAELGAVPLAADLAALLGERDILRGPSGPPDADVDLRLELLATKSPPPVFHGWTVDRSTLGRVRDEARTWREMLRRGAAGPRVPPPSSGSLLALAYPDRVARRRSGQRGRFLLRNGQGASTDSPTLSRTEFVVAAELDGDRRESRLWLGAQLEASELLELFSGQGESEQVIRWDDQADALVTVERRRLGAITLEDRPLRHPDSARVQEVVLGWIQRSGLELLPWSEESIELRQRLAFLRETFGLPWPDVSDSALLEGLEGWLAPSVVGVRRRADLGRIDLRAALSSLLGHELRGRLEALAPTHLPVPSGSRIRVSYSDPAAPVLAVRLQEVFGLTETPRVAGGTVPVTLHLLSPAHRPVQVTRDLAGFWRTSYRDVRKEMKGRYPRHEWPEDPAAAQPTRRARPRRR
jgi:ATP-dependent helicase HrpB